MDAGGDIRNYDSGTLGGMNCGSYDDKGRELFVEVPED